jgi:hypothetical protein
MEETTFVHSPRKTGGQSSPAPIPSKRTAAPVSRSMILSLLVFVLSFAVLFAGPALVLRLMAASVDAPAAGVGPGIFAGQVHAAAEDSSVTLQQGNLPTAGYNGAQDTFLNRWRPDSNYGSDARVSIGQDGAYRTLIYFDLAPAAIPSTASITSAWLGLYCYDRNVDGPIEIGAYQVVRLWSDWGATWRRATVSNLWDVEGCDDLTTDRLASPVYTTTVSGTGDFHYFDITNMVQNWAANPSSNQGVILLAPDHVRIYYYASSEWPAAELRPVLVINYVGTPPTATPTPTLTRTPTPTQTRTPTPTQTLVGPTQPLQQRRWCRPSAWTTALPATVIFRPANGRPRSEEAGSVEVIGTRRRAI